MTYVQLTIFIDVPCIVYAPLRSPKPASDRGGCVQVKLLLRFRKAAARSAVNELEREFGTRKLKATIDQQEELQRMTEYRLHPPMLNADVCGMPLLDVSMGRENGCSDKR